jgi:hypothetical protein
MLKIKVTTNFVEWPFDRQTPHNESKWRKSEFYIDKDIKDCDFWIVDGDLVKTEKAFCCKENTVFLAGEPPSLKGYNKNFLKQFNYIITCDRKLNHPNKIYQQQAIPWQLGAYAGRYGYDELRTLDIPEKTILISAVTSSKDWSGGHRKRMDLIFKLKEYFGDQLDVYGRGISDIEDKSEAILDYKYGIAIENSSYKDYWTEKLSDVFLGFSYPFYYGCPNIYDYFPKNSLMTIDVDDLSGSVKIIENAIKNNYFEKYMDDIQKARELILEEYNFFPMMDKFCNKYFKDGEKTEITIRPERVFEKYNFKKYFNPKKIFPYLKKRFFGQ